MSDDDNGAHGHALGIPAELMQAMARDHDTRLGHAQDRYNQAMSWLDSLDVDGLLALRWVLRTDAEDAYGNCRFFDGMAMQLLRAKGVDPNTGVDPTAQLLERESLRPE